jgi:hypothetical protein
MMMMMMENLIFVPRLLEMSNDVEKNPGPPKVIKNGLIPPASANNKDKPTKMSEKSESKTGGSPTSKTAPPLVVDDGLSASSAADFESLRSVVEKQAEIIRLQKIELEAMRKQMEKNLQTTQDFQSEMSEIRKNWLTICDTTAAAAAPKKPEEVTNTAIASKLESLASAYNDIQDRLYEIDKSWKNNLMIYGVPCNENMEEDTVITEEKVSLKICLKCLKSLKRILYFAFTLSKQIWLKF